MERKSFLETFARHLSQTRGKPQCWDGKSVDGKSVDSETTKEIMVLRVDFKVDGNHVHTTCM